MRGKVEEVIERVGTKLAWVREWKGKVGEEKKMLVRQRMCWGERWG